MIQGVDVFLIYLQGRILEAFDLCGECHEKSSAGEYSR